MQVTLKMALYLKYVRYKYKVSLMEFTLYALNIRQAYLHKVLQYIALHDKCIFPTPLN